MRLRSILLENYRNIVAAELRPERQMTLLHGLNGQGKTNLLEAIYLLGNGRSFRTARIPDLIRQEQPAGTVCGSVLSCGVQSEIAIRLEGRQRRVTVDGKAVQRSSELHGKLAVVVFSPDDTGMVKQGPETRRRFLDRSLYGSNVGFLKEYHDYYRILKQRNSLLRNNSTAGLDVWTEQLITSGMRLMGHRNDYLKQLQPLVQQHYRWISGGREQVSIRYDADLEYDQADLQSRFLNKLQQGLPSDLRHGATGCGPHRDDLAFSIDGRPLKSFGSQGQQRSFVLALKLAELDHLQQTFGEPPLMLLDDIVSELDRERIYNLLDHLRRCQVQVLITTTTTAGIDPDILRDSGLYRMQDGRLTYEGTITR